jgi:hypothetical protein
MDFASACGSPLNENDRCTIQSTARSRPVLAALEVSTAYYLLFLPERPLFDRELLFPF